MKNQLVQNVTLCFTMGGRPDLLEKSIDSIQEKWDFPHIIAVNDFSDSVCDEIFKRKFPDGVLLSDGQKRGHHGAVDWIYQNIQTPYIFHTEDDWTFPEPIDFEAIKCFLDKNPKAISFCFRSPQDFLDKESLRKSIKSQVDDLAYMNLSQIHDEWYSYSFNPHLIKTDTLKNIGSLSNYKKERHISRALKKNGGFVAYSDVRLCDHIGEGMSMANPHAGRKKSLLRLWIHHKIKALKGQ